MGLSEMLKMLFIRKGSMWAVGRILPLSPIALKISRHLRTKTIRHANISNDNNVKPLRTHVYVDGFNLYYGKLKGKPQYKWLNIYALSKYILNHENDVLSLHYFSAKISGERNSEEPIRQEIYFRALQTVPQVKIHLGHFLTKRQTMLSADSWPKGNVFHEVIRTEEKGSDVNLATQLLVDAFDDAFDVAVIISNDGDLKSAISVVRNRFKKIIGIINPHSHMSLDLKPLAHFTKKISAKLLRKSQFPDEIEDSTGKFKKPDSWRSDT